MIARVIGVFMPSRIKKEVAENLARLLADSGITQAQLARDLSISPAAVTKWLQGVSYPSDEHVDAMIDTYRWTKRQIFIGLDEENTIEHIIMEHNNSASPFVIGLRNITKRKATR